jgi:hypothetical protein
MRAFATAAGLLVATQPGTLRAQQWNEPRALELVRLATDRRAQQLADSGLVDYKATAHGYLTFLAQIGAGFVELPKVVKADELALEVYWRTPNHSKQRIIGRRDTTLVPTDIEYHRDHLGIIQNNFPAIIRLGDGDEVRDVPHPLSADGLALYDFAVTDSLRLTIPGRAINVYEVKVRPKDENQPRVVGALYLERENSQVARMALSFTRAAFKDKLLEDLFVVLENGLVGTRFWLPRRQEIEIRRAATWMEHPVRGIIRGRWELENYELNLGLEPLLFAGAEIVQAPPSVRDAYQWPTRNILDSLPPDVRAVTAEEIRRVQAEVRTLVRGQALRRSQGGMLAGQGISDFARFNRVEGLALGAGGGIRAGAGVALTARGRYGFADEKAKGSADIAWRNAAGWGLRGYVSDDHRDVADVAERSGFSNSIAAQEFANDFTNPYGVRAVGIEGRAPWLGMAVSLRVSREQQSALAVNATPATRRFMPTLPVDSADAWRGELRLMRPTRLWWWSTEMRAELALRSTSLDSARVQRGFMELEVSRPARSSRVVSRTLLGGATSSGAMPLQEMVYLGGPLTAPGYRYHSLVDDAAVSQRIEVQFPVPFPALSLGRFGRSAATATLAPFVSVVGLRQSGLYPSVGVGAPMLFDLIRIDVARGLRSGSGVTTWSLDVTRAFWSIL